MERIPNKFLRVLHRHGIFEVKDMKRCGVSGMQR